MQVHRRTTARNGVAIGRSRPVAVRPVAEAPPSGQRDVSAASAATGAVFPQPPPSRPSKQSLLRILGKGDTSALPLPKGNRGWPFIGNTSEYLDKGSLRFGLEGYLKHGPIFAASIFGMDVYMVTTMDMYQAIMMEDTKLVNFQMGGAFNKLQGNNVATLSDNPKGSRMRNRKAMLTAMTNEAQAGYCQRMGEIGLEELAICEQHPVWDGKEFCRRWAMRFANALLAGLDIKSEEDGAALRKDLSLFFAGLVTFDIDLPGTPLRTALEAKDRLMARIEGSVSQQMKEMENEKPAPPGTKVRKNMLGYIIDGRKAEGRPCDATEFAEFALGVLQAGTDTSSSGFIGLYCILMQMPEVWERIREEQRQVVATHGDKITKASMDSSKYLHACIMESLRLTSPGNAQYRVVLQDFEVGGYRLPAGSMLYLNVMTAHALELEPSWGKGWKEGDPFPAPPVHMDLMKIPQAFKPERWLDPNPKNHPSLLTFGHGPHTCVGMALYIYEAKTMVSLMARKYNLERVRSDPQEAELLTWEEMPMMKPTQDVKLRLVPAPNPV